MTHNQIQKCCLFLLFGEGLYLFTAGLIAHKFLLVVLGLLWLATFVVLALLHQAEERQTL